jgi:hypothetical protein
MSDRAAPVPPMAALTTRPYSAFEHGWTYGPITLAQDRHARRYANTCRRTVESVPGWWLMPPAYLTANDE